MKFLVPIILTIAILGIVSQLMLWLSGRMQMERILAGDANVPVRKIILEGQRRSAEISDEATLRWILGQLASKDAEENPGAGSGLTTYTAEMAFPGIRRALLHTYASAMPPAIYFGYEHEHGFLTFYIVSFEEPPSGATNLIDFLTQPEYRHSTWVDGVITE